MPLNHSVTSGSGGPASAGANGPGSLTVEVPELVSFDLELADIGSRFLALLLDIGIRMAALVGILSAWIFVDEFVITEMPGFVQRWAGVAYMLGAFAFWFGYAIFFEATRGGRTPGKSALKLRVVTDFGGPIDWTESFIRNSLRLVDSFPFFYGVGLLTMLLTSRAQRLGDLAAGTIVVRDSSARQVRRELLVGLRELELPEAAGVEPPPRPPLSAREHDILMNYFTRRGEFTPEGRASLARRIVRHLWQDRYEELTGHDPEAVLAAYVRVWRRENPAGGATSGIARGGARNGVVR